MNCSRSCWSRAALTDSSNHMKRLKAATSAQTVRATDNADMGVSYPSGAGANRGGCQHAFLDAFF